MSYQRYKEETLKRLVNEIGNLPGGSWRGKNGVKHILPLDNDTSKNGKRGAIKKYLHFEIDERIPRSKTVDELHTYAHHLNSSQLLCFRSFTLLMNGERPNKYMIDILSEFGINVSSNAECEFEFKDDMSWINNNGIKEYEGTSFDFRIKDGKNQIFFEIKFTENGFGKAKNDSRHTQKIKSLYLPHIAKCPVLPNSLSEEIICNNYQLIRNVIRCKDSYSKVVFITDGNNPKTNYEIREFKNLLQNNDGNVIFITWQEIKDAWRKNHCSVMPFQFCCFS